MSREEDVVVAVSPADGGSGNASGAAAQVLVCLLDLNLRGEVGGSGREAGNGTLVAVAHRTEVCRTNVGGSGGGRVKAQGCKGIEVRGVDGSGSGWLVWSGFRALVSTEIVRHGGSGSGSGSGCESGSGSVVVVVVAVAAAAVVVVVVVVVGGRGIGRRIEKWEVFIG
jgi:hypothetical protein